MATNSCASQLDDVRYVILASLPPKCAKPKLKKTVKRINDAKVKSLETKELRNQFQVHEEVSLEPPTEQFPPESDRSGRENVWIQKRKNEHGT